MGLQSNQFRVYVTPFKDDGTYDIEQEITDDVDFNSFSKISQSLDNTEFNLGIFRFDNFSLKLNNITGRYSDVTVLQSIFRFKRSDSQIRITYDQFPEDAFCGNAFAGEDFLSAEVDVFKGLLNDESLKFDIEDQFLNFRVIGREDLLTRSDVPIASISNGDLVSSVIFDIANQTPFTDLVTVTLGNISPSSDQTIDDKSSLENKTGREAINILLKHSNSIAVIDSNDNFIVKGRAETATSQFSFFGQASENGAENINDIRDIKSGLARTFNFLTWQDTTILVQDVTSVAKFGVRKLELNTDIITDTTKRTNILTDIRDEFSNPKLEFTLTTFVNQDTVSLTILDKVSIDYPTVYTQFEDNPLPIVGVAVIGTAVLPVGQFAFTIDPDTAFKIIGKTLDTKRTLLNLRIREV